ncbi:hypothetical protein Tco_0523372 [Tanacetum coccineum]
MLQKFVKTIDPLRILGSVAWCCEGMVVLCVLDRSSPVTCADPIDPLVKVGGGEGKKMEDHFTCPYRTFAYRRLPFGFMQCTGHRSKVLCATLYFATSCQGRHSTWHKFSKSGILRLTRQKVGCHCKMAHPHYAFETHLSEATQALDSSCSRLGIALVDQVRLQSDFAVGLRFLGIANFANYDDDATKLYPCLRKSLTCGALLYGAIPVFKEGTKYISLAVVLLISNGLKQKRSPPMIPVLFVYFLISLLPLWDAPSLYANHK